MNIDRILALKLVTDVGDINKKTGIVESRFKKMSGAAKQWGKALTTGLVLEGIDVVGEALGNAWEGFRSGQKVADQMGVAWRNLGLDGSKLDATLQRISDSTLKLGTSDDEAVSAFTNSLKTTGDYHESLKRLKIAQDLVANGSAPNLKSAFKLIDKAATGSKGVIDKFGLTSDTAAGRVRELGRKVKGAAKHAADLDPLGVTMNAIDEALEGVVGSFATGDIEAGMASLTALGATLSAAWGTLFDKVTPTMDKLTGGGWSDLSATVGDLSGKVMELATNIGEHLSPLLASMSALWAAIQPILVGVWDAMAPLRDMLSATVDGSLGAVIDLTTGAIKVLTDLLNGDFQGALDDAAGTAGKIADTISDAFDRLVGAVRGGANAVIDALNAINSFSWPRQGFEVNTVAGNFFVGVDAGSINLWPDIAHVGGRGASPNIHGKPASQGGPVSGAPRAPGHKDGLWSVPWDGYMAPLHSGEMVVPSDFAQQLRANGGMGGGVTVIINSLVGDPAAQGREVVRVLRAYTNIGGKVPTRAGG